MIPVNKPLFNGNEKKYLNSCIDSGWVSSEGSFVQQFEKSFSEYVNRQYGIAVSSGSAALDIALCAIGIQPGDEVILPAFTIISPLFSILRCGAKPVLVDSNPKTWNMEVSEIENKITSKTKAILVVHVYGLPVNMHEVIILSKKYNLKIIEDAAEMHGQTCNGEKCGSFGDISIFSFYANKNITTGEGGMLLTDDKTVAEYCYKLKNLAFEPDKPRFVHYEMGWNYRITNLQAAVGLAQLEQIDLFLKKKQKISDYYYNKLSFLQHYGYQLPLRSEPYADNMNWVFGLVAPSQKEKEGMIRHLDNNFVGNRPFFWCMHEQPVAVKKGYFHGERYPVAETLSRNGFYIPSGAGLVEEELEIVCNVFKKFYE